MNQPNIIIILTDDQGYGDLSCMGSTGFRTPNLDRLAFMGVRFTNWYANSPVCSPSRAALLTGRYPGNAGVRAILGGHRTSSGLPGDVPTLARALGELGYQTTLCGKWHLGLANGSRPHDHGFDSWFGFMAGCVDYYSHIFYWGANAGGPANNPIHDLWEDNTEIWHYNGRYLTEVITEKAVESIRRSRRSHKPFFTYVAYNAPHYPMHAPLKYMERFDHLPWDRQIMAAMISAVDDGVGEIMAELVRQDLLENTIIFFMSDNGPSRESRNWLDGTPDPYYGGSAGRLKGHKFSLFDGGIRVPGIIAWPGGIPGGRVIDDPCAAIDLFPTFLSAAGGAPEAYEMDGIDLLALLRNSEPLQSRDLFWEMDDQTAIRRGDWKMVLNGRLVEQEAPITPVFLSNLADDMSENKNLADARPELTADLVSTARTWRAKIEERWEQQWQRGKQGTV